MTASLPIKHFALSTERWPHHRNYELLRDIAKEMFYLSPGQTYEIPYNYKDQVYLGTTARRRGIKIETAKVNGKLLVRRLA